MMNFCKHGALLLLASAVFIHIGCGVRRSIFTLPPAEPDIIQYNNGYGQPEHWRASLLPSPPYRTLERARFRRLINFAS